MVTGNSEYNLETAMISAMCYLGKKVIRPVIPSKCNAYEKLY